MQTGTTYIQYHLAAAGTYADWHHMQAGTRHGEAIKKAGPKPRQKILVTISSQKHHRQPGAFHTCNALQGFVFKTLQPNDCKAALPTVTRAFEALITLEEYDFYHTLKTTRAAFCRRDPGTASTVTPKDVEAEDSRDVYLRV